MLHSYIFFSLSLAYHYLCKTLFKIKIHQSIVSVLFDSTTRTSVAFSGEMIFSFSFSSSFFFHSPIFRGQKLQFDRARTGYRAREKDPSVPPDGDDYSSKMVCAEREFDENYNNSPVVSFFAFGTRKTYVEYTLTKLRTLLFCRNRVL